MRGHWTRGRRRNDCDASAFVRRAIEASSARAVARMAGCSARTVARWASGEDWPRLDAVQAIADALCREDRGSLPIYSPDLAIDGGTRVGGVGDFTLRMAQGQPFLSGDRYGD